MSFALKREDTGLLVIDVQEKLLPLTERHDEVIEQIQKAIKGFLILDLPIVVTEQYPQGLGVTVPEIRDLVGDTQSYQSKTHFSCAANPEIRKKILSMPVQKWVLIGIETHVCVLQTARDLIEAGKKVVVLNDAVTSRSIYDYSTAIAELRDLGARISSVETVLFELVKDSRAPEFKRISQIIK